MKLYNLKKKNKKLIDVSKENPLDLFIALQK